MNRYFVSTRQSYSPEHQAVSDDRASMSISFHPRIARRAYSSYSSFRRGTRHGGSSVFGRFGFSRLRNPARKAFLPGREAPDSRGRYQNVIYRVCVAHQIPQHLLLLEKGVGYSKRRSFTEEERHPIVEDAIKRQKESGRHR